MTKCCKPSSGYWCPELRAKRLEIVFMQPMVFLIIIYILKLFINPRWNWQCQGCSPSSCSTPPGCAYRDKSSHCPQTWMVRGASELGCSSLVMCYVFRWVRIHIWLPWQMWSGLATINWTAHQRHSAMSWQFWRWIGYGVGWYHYDWQNTPTSHPILCKEESLGGTTGTISWHPLSSRLLGVWVDVLLFRTNRQCSPPVAKRLSNAMATNDSRPFSHWTRLGRDNETWYKGL